MRGHIRRRGDKWCAVVFVGRDPQGRRRYQWTTHPTRQLAEEHLADAIGSALAGRPYPSRRMRLAPFLQRWMAGRTPQLRRSTVFSYQWAIDKHILPALGNLYLTDIGPEQVRTLIEQLSKTLSPWSIHKTYAIVRRALEDAMELGLVPANPAARVRYPKPSQRPVRVWDLEQVRLFLAAARRHCEYWLLFKVAIWTGMRIGEVLGLQWADIDWTRRLIQVQRSLGYNAKDGLHFELPKTVSGRRAIAMPAGILKELRSWREQQIRDMNPLLQSTLIFCQPDGSPHFPTVISDYHFHRIAHLAGVPPIRFHDLRHTHASQLLAVGASIKVVQERLGHARASFTLETYAHLLPTIQADAAAALERRLTGRGTPRRLRIQHHACDVDIRSAH